jgi:hypothetical protein
VRFPFATDWRAVVAFDANTLRNSDAIDRAANLNSTEIDAGIRYQTGAQNYVDLLARTGQSTYPDGALSIFAGLNYHDRGVDLRTKWRFSGVSTLEGRLGYMEQRYDESSFLNFAGPAWDLTYTWLPGSKTSLALYTARVTGPAGNNYFSAAVMHTYRLTPTYQLTSNIHLDAHYEWSSVNYFSNLQALAEGLPPATVRSDIDTNYGFGASWTPRRWLIIKLIAVRQQRNSVSTIFDYSDRLTSLSVTAKF